MAEVHKTWFLNTWSFAKDREIRGSYFDGTKAQAKAHAQAEADEHTGPGWEGYDVKVLVFDANSNAQRPVMTIRPSKARSAGRYVDPHAYLWSGGVVKRGSLSDAFHGFAADVLSVNEALTIGQGAASFLPQVGAGAPWVVGGGGAYGDLGDGGKNPVTGVKWQKVRGYGGDENLSLRVGGHSVTLSSATNPQTFKLSIYATHYNAATRKVMGIGYFATLTAAKKAARAHLKLQF